MNPIALGLFILGTVLLIFGITSLMKSKKTKGLILSLLGLLAIAIPFVATYLIAR